MDEFYAIETEPDSVERLFAQPLQEYLKTLTSCDSLE